MVVYLLDGESAETKSGAITIDGVNQANVIELLWSRGLNTGRNIHVDDVP